MWSEKRVSNLRLARAVSHMSTWEWADVVQKEGARGVPLTWLLTLCLILTPLPAGRVSVNVCDQALGQFCCRLNQGSPMSSSTSRCASFQLRARWMFLHICDSCLTTMGSRDMIPQVPKMLQVLYGSSVLAIMRWHLAWSRFLFRYNQINCDDLNSSCLCVCLWETQWLSSAGAIWMLEAM